jgi:small subunit ribosomal protein S1
MVKQNIKQNISESKDKCEELTEFENLLQSYGNLFNHSLIRKGKIISIDEKFIYVDVGDKSDGIISIEEFVSSDGQVNLEINTGDIIEVFVGQYDDRIGYLRLSKEKAESLYILDDIEKIYAEGETIKGTVTAKTKGGLIVDLNGVAAFLPGSQIDIKLTRDFDSYIGKTLDFKIINYNKKNCNIILSRRKIIEEDIKKLRENVFTEVSEGDILEGIVKNITDYGAFVDLGGLDGLIYITDISWKRISHPSEVFYLGQKIKVKVIKHDKEKNRVSLSYKQLFPDPWENVLEKHKVGDITESVIINITDYGVFVELNDDVEGLIHISEMIWDKKQIEPKSIATKGQRVKAVILSIEPDSRKMSLSMKQLIENPWNKLKDKYTTGAIVDTIVKNIFEFGISVELEENFDGFIKQSDFSWTKRPRHPQELFKKNDHIKAIVISIDDEKQRIYLGIKQLTENPWKTVKDRYAVGTTVSGVVSNITEFGIFVGLEESIEGLIHKSKIPDDFIENNNIHINSTIRSEIISVDPIEQKIGLSLINVE